MRRVFALALLVLSGAAPEPKLARADDLAEQLTMLAFDANPLWAAPAREGLSRWAGPMRLYVFGRAEERADAQAALAALARPTRLRLQVLDRVEAARAIPNAFVVADENLALVFRGPLRAMLDNAFLDDPAAVEQFQAGVIDHAPCWVLPIFADPAHTIVRAAIIGADTTAGRAATGACILHGLGGALGLMGPGAFLPDSAFAPSASRRLSRDDERMLTVLYGTSLRPGMSRDDVLAASARAFAGARKTNPKPAARTPLKIP